MKTIKFMFHPITIHSLKSKEKKSIQNVLLYLIISMFLFSCGETNKNFTSSTDSEISPTTEINDVIQPKGTTSSTETPPSDDTTQITTTTTPTTAPAPSPPLAEDLAALKTKHSEMLEPISSLKSSNPKMYSFIISWLETNYKTPDWTNYGSENWQQETKVRGIDCSGFARVMQDKIFNKKIAGGSQGLLDNYCTRVPRNESKMGDLVFFKAYKSETEKIVHVGVYLMNNYFVHATSTDSAKKGLGLKIDSLKGNRWDEEFVATGRIKE
jgi:cell wall-associated NlpC family hydrolase